MKFQVLGKFVRNSHAKVQIRQFLETKLQSMDEIPGFGQIRHFLKSILQSMNEYQRLYIDHE